MEADTLGGLDITFIKPGLAPKENERYVRGVNTARMPKFITEYGKKEAERLLISRRKYYATFISA